MYTHDLTAELVVSPAAGTRPPRLRAQRWLYAAAALVVLAAKGLEAHLGAVVGQHGAEFFAGCLLLAWIVLAAARAAFGLAAPDDAGGLRAWRLALAALALWICGEVAEAFAAARFFAPKIAPKVAWNEGICALTILLLAATPILLAFALLKRTGAVRPGRAGAAAALAGSALAAFAAQFCCPVLVPLHLLLWHVLPVLAVTLAGSVLGRFWFEL